MTAVTQSPRIGILVINMDGASWLTQFWPNLLQQDYPNYRVYLLDNGSVDDSVALTRHSVPGATVIQFPRNMGYSMAYNLAMPIAFEDGCDWVVWSNNDVRLEPGCLRALTLAAATDKGIGIIGPAFLDWESDEASQFMHDRYPDLIPAIQVGQVGQANQVERSKPADVDWVEGSFLMVSAECVAALGGLDPYLFLYWEDVDFCRRAKFHGWRVTLATTALARHFGSGTALTAAGKTRRNHMVTRNYFVTTLANPAMGFAHNVLRCLRLLGGLLKQGLRGEGPAALFVLTIFLRLLPEWSVIYKKWLRDRKGIRPPQVSAAFAQIRPVISRDEYHKRADGVSGCGST